jgi:hypothetical protein
VIKAEHATAFSLSASITYTLAYYFNWPLFRYYPAVNQISWHAQSPTAGASILWYGWLATAVLAGVVIAVVLPTHWVKRVWDDIQWSIPLGLVIAVLIYEMRWFVH